MRASRRPLPALVCALWLSACTDNPRQDPADPNGGHDGADAAQDEPNGAPCFRGCADAGDADSAETPTWADAGWEKCLQDKECRDGDYCDLGACTTAPEIPFVALTSDGVTRAGAARFDVTPAYVEQWTDRAGDACPSNRLGLFDGLLDDPEPADPCADGFIDANGNGRFDGVWLGGGRAGRPALSVDNDNPPAGRALVLTRDEQIWVLLTLDLYALDAARVQGLARRLALRLSIPPHSIAVHTTGTRSGPDAVGLWGPPLSSVPGPQLDALKPHAGSALGLLDDVPAASGVDEAWWTEVERRAWMSALDAGRRLEPVAVRADIAWLPMDPDPIVAGELELPDANGDGQLNDEADRSAFFHRPQWLSRDLRLPVQRDRRVHIVELQSTGTGTPAVVLLGWGAAPASRSPKVATLSADYPGVARSWIEQKMAPAVAIWLTTAAGDTVVADAAALVPETDERGIMRQADGEPAAQPSYAAPAADSTRSLGRLVASRARAAQAEAPISEAVDATLNVTSRYAWVPITNPRYGLAARLGLMKDFGAWLTGRVATAAWSSGTTTPSCGGLGCFRYRLDRVELGPITLLMMPGAPDDAYVRGRAESAIYYGDARNLSDLDADGVLDGDDVEIRVATGPHGQPQIVELPGPVNPQFFPATQGLANDRIWVVGRTNGGVGSLCSTEEHVNVFEGQVDALVEYASDEVNAALDLCQAGYPCDGALTVGELVTNALADQPDILSNVPGTHELWLVGAEFPEPTVRIPWRVETDDGTVRVDGDDLELGPANRAFTLSANLADAGVRRTDRLVLPEPHDPAGFEVGGIVPVELRRHPNVGDAWTAVSHGQGDLVYNTACELLYGGTCPDYRQIRGDDPNRVLPRSP